MNTLANYHTHAKYCDGQGELREYVQSALQKDMSHLGFSCHSPVPFETDWIMPQKLLPQYLSDARAIKKEYAETIDIYVGLEVDYIPEISSPAAPHITALGLDFTIGSVHFLGVMEDGLHWTVDGPLSEIEAGIVYTFGGNVKAAVSRYYEMMSIMALTTPPDVLGHFDLIKLNNVDNRFFSEQEGWYRQLVRETLIKIAKSSSLLEVNTGGIIRNSTSTLYPSEWILKECLELDIPIVVGSDAHRPADIDGYFPETFAILKKIGYRKHFIRTAQGWKPEDL